MKIHNMEQGTPEWLEIRLGMPTASCADKLITPARREPSKSMKPYAQELAGDKFAGYVVSSWEGNQYTERGHEVEPEARSWYAMETDTPIQEVGFITHDTLECGCSPDGLVGDDGLVEIKCLPKNHIKALLVYKNSGKPPSDYIPQIHFQLLVTDRAWVDLVYYSPALPSISIRIERDKEMDTLLEKQIKACLEERDATYAMLQEIAA